MTALTVDWFRYRHHVWAQKKLAQQPHIDDIDRLDNIVHSTRDTATTPTGKLGWKTAKLKAKRIAQHRGKVRPGFEHLRLPNEQRQKRQSARRQAVLEFVTAESGCTAKDAQAHVIANGHRGSISTILNDLRSLANDGEVRMMQPVPRVAATYEVIG